MILLTEELLAQQANDGIQAALLAAGMTAWELPKPPTGPRRRVSEQVINRMRGVGPYRLTIQERMGLDTIHVMGEGAGGLWVQVTVTWDDDYSFRVDSLGAQCTRLWLYRFTPRHVPTPTAGQRLLSADLNRVLTHSRLVLEEIGDVLATASGSCAPPVPPGIVYFGSDKYEVENGSTYTVSWHTSGTEITTVYDGETVAATGYRTYTRDEGQYTHQLTVHSDYGPPQEATLVIDVLAPPGPATLTGQTIFRLKHTAGAPAVNNGDYISTVGAGANSTPVWGVRDYATANLADRMTFTPSGAWYGGMFIQMSNSGVQPPGFTGVPPYYIIDANSSGQPWTAWMTVVLNPGQAGNTYAGACLWETMNVSDKTDAFAIYWNGAALTVNWGNVSSHNLASMLVVDGITPNEIALVMGADGINRTFINGQFAFAHRTDPAPLIRGLKNAITYIAANSAMQQGSAFSGAILEMQVQRNYARWTIPA